MEEAYIVEAARSPVGKFLGAFSGISATSLGAAVSKALLEKASLKPEHIESIIVGNVLSAALGQNPAKQVAMASGLPMSVPTLNANMVCASGLRAVSLAAQSVMLGDYKIVLAGGIESMSRAPYTIEGVRAFKKLGDVNLSEFSEFAKKENSEYTLKDEMILDGLWDCYSQLHMGAIVEKIARKYNITREEQDRFALESHKRAAEATYNGAFKDEIVEIKSGEKLISADEGIRKDTTMEKLSALKPAFSPNGTVTAGNASQLSDGAAFAIVASGSIVKELGLHPIAKIESYAEAGIDPQWYGLSPVDSMKKSLSKTGMSVDDVGLIELNEAFAAQMLGDIKEMQLDTSKVNVNGGAIAIGHPIGASGSRLLATLAHAMVQRKKDYGLVSLCHGGGGSASMLISRVD